MSDTLLKLPNKKANDQKRSKAAWNLEHCTSEADFYTVGYSGRDIKSFVQMLINAEIATLVDIRYTPLSRFKPEFSKNNLKNALESNGITYLHKPDWGVPRDVRATSVGQNTRDKIWAWYDANVLPRVLGRNLDQFFNSMDHPVALMCQEYDPTECHRHRLFLGLERLGLRGCDL